MIFRTSGNRLEMNTLDFLVLPGVAYLGAGVIYGAVDVKYVNPESVYSLFTLILFGVLFRNRSFLEVELSMSRRLEKKLLLISALFVFSIVAFFLSVGLDYFRMDKIERSQLISQYFVFRVGFWASSILVILLICEKERRFRRAKAGLIVAMFSILVLEGSRELLLIVGVQFIFYQWFFKKRLIFPQGFSGFLAFIFLLFFVTVLFKPIFYIITVGEFYDGGWLNFGELVNWYRWLNQSYVDGIDVAYVQRNDLLYLVQAFYLPFSTVESSSSVWFTEILGNEEGQGRTYGYSGVLWLSAYFPGLTIMLPWLATGVLFSLFANARKPASFLFVFAVCLVSYRLFRSEWVLVVKTVLWLFFYPSFLIFTFARFRLR